MYCLCYEFINIKLKGLLTRNSLLWGVMLVLSSLWTCYFINILWHYVLELDLLGLPLSVSVWVTVSNVPWHNACYCTSVCRVSIVWTEWLAALCIHSLNRTTIDWSPDLIPSFTGGLVKSSWRQWRLCWSSFGVGWTAASLTLFTLLIMESISVVMVRSHWVSEWPLIIDLLSTQVFHLATCIIHPTYSS